jgi:Contractile injection system tube protein/LysM domain
MSGEKNLAKLTIKPDGGQDILVLFNPNSYTISKSVTWNADQASGGKNHTKIELNAPPLKFGGGGSRQLSMELFFDVTEQPGKDVRDDTDQIAGLTRIGRGRKDPPPCTVVWGAPRTPKGDFPFRGVVSSLTQKFTLFNSNGTPIRATLNVTFTEFLKPEDDKLQTDPDYTVHVIKRGDTLSNVAAKMYGDPARWRAIAERNDIDNPIHLEIGRRLGIPDVGE